MITPEQLEARRSEFEIDPNFCTDHYILEGKEAVPEYNLFTWAKWIENNPEKRHVAVDYVNGDRVSTVFLALNHAYSPVDQNPILFETMVFGGKMHGAQERYSTWQEAEEGHARMVKAVRAKQDFGQRFFGPLATWIVQHPLRAWFHHWKRRRALKKAR